MTRGKAPMQNAEYPWHDRAIEAISSWTFHFIMRNGGHPPRHRLRFWLGWKINDMVCCPLIALRYRIWRTRGWSR